MCFLYLSMRPQPRPQQANRPEEKPAVAADPLLRDDGGDGEVPVAEEETTGDGGSPAAKNPSRLITLGSLNPSKNYNLSVALSSKGGSLERVELVEQTSPGRFRFRALEHDGGYLGYLGLVAATEGNGLLVRTIPDGSAAALAKCNAADGGLQVGDALLELDGQSLATPEAMESVLKSSKPGKTVELLVRRDDSTLRYQVELGEAPLDMIRLSPGENESVPGNRWRPALLTTIASLNSTTIPDGEMVLPALRETLDVDWAVKPLDVPGGEGVEFRLPLDSFLSKTGRPSKLDLVKRYRLLPRGEDSDGFLLDLETELINRNDEAVSVALRQEGLNGLTLEGWWYSVKISPYMFSGAGQRDVIYNSEFEGHSLSTTRQILDRARTMAPGSTISKSPGIYAPPGQSTVLFSELEPPEARKLKYIGLDAQYFNASILPYKPSPAGDIENDSLSDLSAAEANVIADPLTISKSQAQAANVFFWIDTQEKGLEAGEKLSQRYQIFLGPKDAEVLAAHGLDRAIEYGWFPWIAKPLSAILHFFHMIIPLYGVAIVMLTVMVRGAMFPLGRKAAMNAQRMQELQPELKKINDMYKDNMEKRAKAMQDLYAKHNFKPLAGCLPMFIQLPIFIGLYRCLSVDISLRQQPLIPGVVLVLEFGWTRHAP